MTLIRGRPESELMPRISDLNREMNRLFDSYFRGDMVDDGTIGSSWTPAVDILEKQDSYVLEAELPGLKKEDDKISVQDNILTLRGEKKDERKESRKPPFDYGLGWFVNESRGGRIIQHGGGTPGFASIFYRYPDDGVSVIALTNHADRVLDTLAIDIAGLTKGALKRASEGDADPATTALVRKSVEELTAGARDKTRYSAAMNLFLDSATGAGFWTWYASMGPLGAVNCPEIDRNESGARVECRVRFGGEPYWLTAFLTRENKIAQIALW